MVVTCCCNCALSCAECSSFLPFRLAPRCSHKEDTDHISNSLYGCGERRYIYQHPIFIPIATTATCLTIPSDASLGEALLFNLALSTHLSVLAGLYEDPEEQHFVLDRAIELYSMAYKLELYHHSDGSENASSQSPPSVLFLAAIANNLSEAYRLQLNEGKADSWGRYLLSMLMWILICQRDDERYDSLEHLTNATSNRRRRMAVDSAIANAAYNGFSRRSHNSNNHNQGGNHNSHSIEGDILDCFLGNTMHLIVAKEGRDADITAPAA